MTSLEQAKEELTPKGHKLYVAALGVIGGMRFRQQFPSGTKAQDIVDDLRMALPIGDVEARKIAGLVRDTFGSEIK